MLNKLVDKVLIGTILVLAAGVLTTQGIMDLYENHRRSNRRSKSMRAQIFSEKTKIF